MEQAFPDTQSTNTECDLGCEVSLRPLINESQMQSWDVQALLLLTSTEQLAAAGLTQRIKAETCRSVLPGQKNI